jgi:dienelactone hydrolase
MKATENEVHNSFKLHSAHGNRPFLADATYTEDSKPKPVVLFIHGFKGFKDWGPFNTVARHFARAGFVFIKMNFSRNGTTVDRPEDFADLEAFSDNNFSIELDDSGVLIDRLFAGNLPVPEKECDLTQCFMLGHSRGGAHTILKAGEDARIRKIVTWAAVADLEAWALKENLEKWKTEGVIYVPNSRTNQQMPLKYQIVEDYLSNRGRLAISSVLPSLNIPVMAVHGSADATVPVQAALLLRQLKASVQVEIIEGADHTFGATHPWQRAELPDHMAEATEKTIAFLKHT